MKTDHSPLIEKPPYRVGLRRVLIVEDHAPTLAAIESILQSEFPRIKVVGTARDGDTARRAVRNSAPNIVVLDLDLGGEYGLDLMSAIDGTQDIAVVILTSSEDPLERKRAALAGATAFVSKFSPAEELISAIMAVRPRANEIGDLSCRTDDSSPAQLG